MRRFPIVWLVPSLLLLAAQVAWGLVAYPGLPDRIPQHIGTGGVDTWTDKSVGSAFLLIFTYAGVTVLFGLCTLLMLRVTPREELPPAGTDGAWPLAGAMTNRPATRKGAQRVARALLVMNAAIGVSLTAGCAMLWHPSSDGDVPVWLTVVLIAPIVLSTLLVVAEAIRDRASATR